MLVAVPLPQTPDVPMVPSVALLQCNADNPPEEPTLGRQDDLDNHANQLNPNNDAYWESRGFGGRPDGGDDDDDWDLDWDETSESTSDSHDGPPAAASHGKMRALLLTGGVAASGVAAAMMLPLAKRLKDRLGRKKRPS